MRRELLLVFVAAVALYLPTARYGFVQDDRAIIASNPAAHSIGAALRAFDDPYWPRATGAGLYRPVTILSYAIDWTVSGGRPGWLHVMNADRKSTRLNSSHSQISYAVFCLKKKKLSA